MLGADAEEKQPTNPRENANLLSTLFFIWPFSVIYKGYRKSFTKSDIFRPLSTHRAEVLGERLDEFWQEELFNSIKRKKPPSLTRAIYRCFKGDIILTGIITVIFELGIRIMLPLILRQVLIYFSSDSKISKTDAICYAFLFAVSVFVVPLYVHNYFLALCHLGMKIRVACCSIIYRKSLRTSLMALGEISLGQLVNMLSNDVNKFDLGIVWFHMVWISPIILGLTFLLMYHYLGWGGLVGGFISLGFLPVLFYSGNKIGRVRANVAPLTDERVRTMTEIISAVQIIKMYAWEKQFSEIIENCRRKELLQISQGNLIRAIIASLNMYVGRIALFGCVLTYYYTKQPLTAESVFVVATYLLILKQILYVFLPQGIVYTTEAYISVKRIESFLLIDEIDETKLFKEYYKKHEENINNTTKHAIEINNAQAKWAMAQPKLTLRNINITIEKGELVAIVGSVGSGKSSLFQLILNELSLLSGTCKVNGKISYSSQEPWLFGASVRQNILFGLPMNKGKYQGVIRVCCLESDLKIFPFGDRTLVGEKGISLSGGQKARITLARAVYRDADIYLLDDPLSAVDTNVGNKLFFKCISDYLKKKTCLLITHQIQFLKHVDKVIVFNRGRIVTIGTFDEVQSYQEYFGKTLQSTDNIDDPKKLKSSLSLSMTTSKVMVSSTAMAVTDLEQMAPEEEQKQGNITWDVYKSYFSFGARPLVLFILVLLFVMTQVVASISDVFVNLCIKEHKTASQSNKKMNTLIILYTIITLFVLLLTLIRASVYAHFCTQASLNLHNTMFHHLLEGTMEFFNVNPSGQILNRFSKDLGSIDELLPMILIDLSQMLLQLIGTVVVVLIVNIWLLIVIVFVFFLCACVRAIYVPTSQCVKRLDSITRSPVYTYMSNTFQGLATIRAFGKQELLIEEFDRLQNLNCSTWYLFIALSRFIGFWLDTVAVVLVVAVVASFFFKENRSEDVASDAGLAITQVMGLLGLLQWAVRQSTEFEGQMVSVERILEYTKIDKETSGNSKTRIADWPTEGAIQFKNVSLYYTTSGRPILHNLTFSIQSKEKIGIVGRTGAGKSSLINALFRLAIIDGTILIDGIDTSKINLQVLRSKISIIPQQPIVFTGTLRKNLDPFDNYTDANVWKALEQVNFDLIENSKLSLNFMIAEAGCNLSVGEKQLICLARAVLKNNKILILDEATSNVDPITDALIQNTIRTTFESCTVLTIAHRLGTIMDSDRVLVLSFGNVVEFDHPFLLLQNIEGSFSNMVAKTGTHMSKILYTTAEESYKKMLKKQF